MLILTSTWRRVECKGVYRSQKFVEGSQGESRGVKRSLVESIGFNSDLCIQRDEILKGNKILVI